MFANDVSEVSRENRKRMAVSPLLSGLHCHLVMVNGEAATLKDAQLILQKARSIPVMVICQRYVR